MTYDEAKCTDRDKDHEPSELANRKPKTISKGAVSSGFFGFWVLDVARTTVRLTVNYVSVCVCVPQSQLATDGAQLHTARPKRACLPCGQRLDRTRPDQTKASIGIDIDVAPCVSARICFSILCRSFSAVSLLYRCMCVCVERRVRP